MSYSYRNPKGHLRLSSWLKFWNFNKKKKKAIANSMVKISDHVMNFPRHQILINKTLIKKQVHDAFLARPFIKLNSLLVWSCHPVMYCGCSVLSLIVSAFVCNLFKMMNHLQQIKGVKFLEKSLLNKRDHCVVFLPHTQFSFRFTIYIT